MAPLSLTQWCINLRRRKPPPLSMLPICLACVTSFLILLYMSYTFDNFFHLTKIFPADTPTLVELPNQNDSITDDLVTFSDQNGPPITRILDETRDSNSVNVNEDHLIVNNTQENSKILKLTSPPKRPSMNKPHKTKYEEEVYHDKEIFFQNYNEMKKSLKIYIYPHKKDEPFAHALLPTDDHYKPGGNYASEAYFKNVLFKSHFVTKDPSEADLFFLPFSIASLRLDRKIGVGGLSDFILNYMTNIIQNYPYWNRTGGADHFYAACHSIGRVAMEKVDQVKSNAIQVVCSSSYFLTNYFAHKDVSLPQIWPRHEESLNLASLSKRKKLAFFAGTANSPLRKAVVQTWENDSSIFVRGGRLKTPYSEQLLGSKYCLHVKGFEVNTARVGDAFYYGCVY
uniref:Exostosin GT47 domain-containing protein n=1 Tax=Chenopodium quinoa TaxID=63459 RepID=A0A803N3D5_CHEQI